jgi:nucleoside-diphosphate kinase
MLQRTLLIVKPHAYDLTSEIMKRVLVLEAKFISTYIGEGDLNRWHQHYIEHQGKNFYEELCMEMANKPVSVFILEGEEIIPKLRKLVGVTDPSLAEEGTLRKEFGASRRHNAVHASDSVESAEREIKLWYGK